MTLAGSTVLSLLNVTVMWAISKGLRRAWLAMLVMQALWVPYDVLTGQPGLLLLGAACAWVAWGAWRRETR